jgi:hypothetical protein
MIPNTVERRRAKSTICERTASLRDNFFSPSGELSSSRYPGELYGKNDPFRSCPICAKSLKDVASGEDTKM